MFTKEELAHAITTSTVFFNILLKKATLIGAISSTALPGEAVLGGSVVYKILNAYAKQLPFNTNSVHDYDLFGYVANTILHDRKIYGGFTQSQRIQISNYFRALGKQTNIEPKIIYKMMTEADPGYTLVSWGGDDYNPLSLNRAFPFDVLSNFQVGYDFRIGQVIFDQGIGPNRNTHFNDFIKFLKDDLIISYHISELRDQAVRDLANPESPALSKLAFMLKSYMDPLADGKKFDFETARDLKKLVGSKVLHESLKERLLKTYGAHTKHARFNDMAAVEAYLQKIEVKIAESFLENDLILSLDINYLKKNALKNDKQALTKLAGLLVSFKPQLEQGKAFDFDTAWSLNELVNHPDLVNNLKPLMNISDLDAYLELLKDRSSKPQMMARIAKLEMGMRDLKSLNSGMLESAEMNIKLVKQNEEILSLVKVYRASNIYYGNEFDQLMIKIHEQNALIEKLLEVNQVPEDEHQKTVEKLKGEIEQLKEELAKAKAPQAPVPPEDEAPIHIKQAVELEKSNASQEPLAPEDEAPIQIKQPVEVAKSKHKRKKKKKAVAPSVTMDKPLDTHQTTPAWKQTKAPTGHLFLIQSKPLVVPTFNADNSNKASRLLGGFNGPIAETAPIARLFQIRAEIESITTFFISLKESLNKKTPGYRDMIKGLVSYGSLSGFTLYSVVNPLMCNDNLVKTYLNLKRQSQNTDAFMSESLVNAMKELVSTKAYGALNDEEVKDPQLLCDYIYDTIHNGFKLHQDRMNMDLILMLKDVLLYLKREDRVEEDIQTFNNSTKAAKLK